MHNVEDGQEVHVIPFFRMFPEGISKDQQGALELCRKVNYERGLRDAAERLIRVVTGE